MSKGYRGFASKQEYQDHYSDPAKYAAEIPAMEEYAREADAEKEEWLKDWRERNRILAMAIDAGAQEFGPNTWNISFTSEAWSKFLTALMQPQPTHPVGTEKQP